MFNPYQSIGPLTSMGLPAASATAGIAKTGINWASLLTNTQKTLNIVNQAIPLVYQVKPIISNAKTIFKVANELNKTNNQNDQTQIQNNNIDSNYTNGPKFFI